MSSYQKLKNEKEQLEAQLMATDELLDCVLEKLRDLSDPTAFQSKADMAQYAFSAWMGAKEGMR